MAADRMDLHESYCLKNNMRCPQCNDVVLKADLDKHVKENHGTKKCPFCGTIVDSKALDQHSQICENKPELCHFCEMAVPKDQFKDHALLCGARTEVCPICLKNVLRRGKTNVKFETFSECSRLSRIRSS